MSREKKVALIIGAGEVGSSLGRVLEPHFRVFLKDIDYIGKTPRPDVMHVCLRYTPKFEQIVRGYIIEHEPALVDICSTVPPGTTEKFGSIAVHSTTRGMHPNLDMGIKTFVKHIGGPRASVLADYYAAAGIKTRLHNLAKTTELAHILSNSVYGINLLFAEEMSHICRNYGLDYTQVVLAYNETNNEGYEALDHKGKFRMLLTPPQTEIGGHCIRQGAELIPIPFRTQMLKMLTRGE